MSKGMTIGQLARRSGLSRSALLYYDRLGLLAATGRTGGNYRLYGDAAAKRLQQICLYRALGIPLKEIVPLLDQADRAGKTESILQRRLTALETQIESLQNQQRQIVRLLEQFGMCGSATRRNGSARSGLARPTGKERPGPMKKEKDVVSKKRWVEIMTAAGFTDEDKQNWHRQFEKMEPEAHQEFLESLGIDAEEIARIRQRSRS